MTTTDIDVIRKELNNFVEVELPYKFTESDHIKYITLKGDDEQFYKGGKFVKYGNEKIILSNGGKQWSFKTKVRNNNNDVIYVSRIFINKNNSNKIKNIQENQLNKTILAQQKIIDKMSEKIILLENENKKYKNIIINLKKI